MTIGDRVSCSLRRRHSRQAQLSQVSRQGRLRYVPPAVEEQFSQVFLAADGPLLDDLEDCGLALSLVGHGADVSTRRAKARDGLSNIDHDDNAD